MKPIRKSTFGNSRHTEESSNLCDQEREQFKIMLDLIDEVVFILDQDFHVAYVNQFTFTSFDKTIDELIGRSFHEIFPYTHSILNLETIRQTLASGDKVVSDVQSPFSGRSFRVTGVGFRDKFLFFMRETTTEHSYQELLLEKDSRFTAVTSAMSDVIIIVDPGNRIRYVSPAITLATGYTPDKLEDHKIFDFLDPQHIESAKRYLKDLPQKPRDYANMTFFLKHTNGNLVVFHAADPEITNNSGIDGIILTHRP